MSNIKPVEIPPAFQELFQPARYKVFWGGRGAGKTENFGRALIATAYTRKINVLCSRMYQNSIDTSVYKVLVEIIYEWGLAPWFDIQSKTIICKITGSQFIFKGLQRNIQEIKSMKGIDIFWVDEAISVTDDAWLYLDPTFRENNSEVWVSFNPDEERAPTQVRFVENKHRLTDINGKPNYFVKKVSWRDNPFFNDILEAQRRNMLRDDPDNYDWVWEGEFRQLVEASVFHNKILIKPVDEPEPKTRFYHGMDFGFSTDPSVLIRCWIKPSEEGFGEDLIIDREAYGHQIEIDDMPNWMDATVETARNWPIKADNARPETISYLARQGYSISPAEKWKGSVEDGIAHLRGFRKIIIDPERCPNAAREMRLYRYKVDERSLDINGKPQVLPILLEKWDHVADSCRYALDGMIQMRGGLGVWKKLLSG